MAVEEPTATPATALTRSQAARRARVIRAAMELASEGGYDAVQMRDVATRAGVAMGTIYRYFTSKDHLLAAAMAEWTEELRGRVTQAPPRGDTVAERVTDVLRRASRAVERSPKLTAALITALASPEPSVADCQREITRATEAAIASAIGDADVGERTDIVRILSHVWYSALVGWVNGWAGVRPVSEELETAAHLLLDPR